jgi:hypothetical protein
MTNDLKYQMVIQWSEEDQSFLVGFPIFQARNGVPTETPTPKRHQWL